MGSGTSYLENALLDHVFGGGDYSRPASLFVGLSTTAIDQTGGNLTEPDATAAYARVEVANDATTFPAATQVADKGTKQNAIVIQFPTATGPWGTVTHYFISDEATGGNMISFGELQVHKAVTSGDTVQFAVGNLTITLA
jgi:hypothetical protein